MFDIHLWLRTSQFLIFFRLILLKFIVYRFHTWNWSLLRYLPTSILRYTNVYTYTKITISYLDAWYLPYYVSAWGKRWTVNNVCMTLNQMLTIWGWVVLCGAEGQYKGFLVGVKSTFFPQPDFFIHGFSKYSMNYLSIH